MNKYLLIAVSILIVSSKRIHKQESELDVCAQTHCNDLEISCFGENFKEEQEPTTDCAKLMQKCLQEFDIFADTKEKQEEEEKEVVDCLQADPQAEALAQCVYDNCLQDSQERHRKLVRKLKHFF